MKNYKSIEEIIQDTTLPAGLRVSALDIFEKGWISHFPLKDYCEHLGIRQKRLQTCREAGFYYALQHVHVNIDKYIDGGK